GGIGGTGLGLHIVKEIVQGHGGTVGFDSRIGQGTTFRLHLPQVWGGTATPPAAAYTRGLMRCF
ncbi:MAG TPA: ATP-binding protein, partial [Ferruginibacter sp.]|nr:ATP-binding protein [Ferruginibacter sp.]